jgi:hypothetical protein
MSSAAPKHFPIPTTTPSRKEQQWRRTDRIVLVAAILISVMCFAVRFYLCELKSARIRNS